MQMRQDKALNLLRNLPMRQDNALNLIRDQIAKAPRPSPSLNIRHQAPRTTSKIRRAVASPGMVCTY